MLHQLFVISKHHQRKVVLRLRGRGLEYQEYRGDQIVEIIIVLPDNLSDSEIALYQRLNELSMENY